MTHRRLFWTLAAALGAAPVARADSVTFPVGPASFTVTAGTPSTHSSASQAALTNVLGYSLAANWTAGANMPYSADLRLSVTGPGGTASSAQAVGGAGNSNPFTFPGTVNSGGVFTNLTAALPSYAAGSYSATFTTPFPLTSFTLANASVTVYSKPSSVTGTTAGGPAFSRPAVEDFGDGGGTGVRYATNKLFVGTTGRYLIAAAHTGYNGALYVYQGSFNPASPLTNLLGAAEIPDTPAAPSVLSLNLIPGTEYVVVATGFSSGDAGAFSLYAAGPGATAFNPVPEPAAVLLAAAAVLAVGRRVRAKSRAAVE